MGVKKRVFALLLAVLLSFGVCAVDYLKVDALEVGGSVVWDTAINYLLGLLGLSPIAENGDKIVDFDSMRSKWVQDYEAYFYANVQPEDLPEGYTKERAYQNWIDNVCRGNLNTVEYGAWDIFKEWAETLPSENSGGGSGGSSSGAVSVHLSDITSYVKSVYGQDLNLGNSLVDGVTIDPLIDVTSIVITVNGPNSIIGHISTNPASTITPKLNSIGKYNFNVNLIASTQYPMYYLPSTNGGNWAISRSGSYTSLALAGETLFLYPDFSDLTTTNTSTYYFPFTSSASGYAFDSVVPVENITNLEVINDYSTTTTQNVVSIDWDKIGAMISDAVGTVTGSLDRTITDALDDAQDKVASGTMSVANYNDYVTEISNTYVYDITNETSITNPDSTVTGVVSGNVSKAEFTLAGLQYVFPFCIPWDIKDFVTLLVADPVAPVIEYPIYNPVTDNDEIVSIDFSIWETQVRIIRYIFDFLLIIGLLLLARSLIGAGGGD